MAEHIRTTIRAAIKAQLVAALPAIEIHSARSRPIGMKGSGQVIEILIPRERSSLQGLNCDNSPEYEREIEVMLIGYSAATSDDGAADSADLLALNIELAIHNDDKLGGKVQQMWLKNTDFTLDPASYSNASFAQTWGVLVNISLADMSAA